MSNEEELYDQAIVAARRHAESTSPGPPRSFHRILALLGFGAASFAAWRGALRLYDYWCKNLPTIKWSSSGTISVVIPPVATKEVALDSENNSVTPTIEFYDEERLTAKVVVHLSPRGYYTPCVSPFPLKLETFMRVAQIPYEVDFSPEPKSSSKPATWITIDGIEIVEPHEMIPRLSEVFEIDLEKSVRQQSRLTASRLVGIMLDNHIYWGITLWRWVYDQGRSMKHIQPLTPMTPDALAEIAESVASASWYHGFGRKTQDEVMDLVLVDLADLSAALGNHDYFLGQQPGQVDCGAFAMLAQMLWNMPNSPFEAAMKKYVNLQNFVLRMRERFWPDWDDLLEKNGQVKLIDHAFYPTTNEFQESRAQIPIEGDKKPGGKSRSRLSAKMTRPVGLAIAEQKTQKDEIQAIRELSAKASYHKELPFSSGLNPVSPVVDQDENLRRKMQEDMASTEQRLNQNLVNHNPASYFIHNTAIHIEHDHQGLLPAEYYQMPQMYVNQLQQFPQGDATHGANHPYFSNPPFRPDFVLAGNPGSS